MKKGNYFIVFGLLLFLPALVIQLVWGSQVPEVIGNIIYGLLLVGVFINIIYFFLEQKKEMKK